jgi:hypothetical protein
VAYPRYSADKNDIPIISNLIQAKQVPQRLVSMFESLFYLGFFTFPLAVLLKKPKLNKFILLLSVILASAVVLFLGIFPLGNIFYLDGLYTSSVTQQYITVINNIPIKLLCSIMIGYSIISLTLFLLNLRKKLTPEISFTGLVFLGSFAILFLGNDMYDRYLLPAFISLAILCAIGADKIGADKHDRRALTTGVAGVIFLLFTSFFLVYDYAMVTKLRWQAARTVSQSANVKTKIYLDTAYTKYIVSRKIKDYTGLTYIDATLDYICYTQVFRDNALPENFELLKKRRVQLHTPDSRSSIIYEKEFYSPLYSLVGAKSKVLGWCNSDKK